MRNTALIYLLGLYIFIATSCSGNSSENPPIPPTETITPSAATLVFPENNTECNEGVIRSTTESTVNFRWEVAENADTYQVNLRNLNTNEERLINSTATNLDITILRATPYAWSVISRSNSSSESTTSEVFLFYNAGLPLNNFAPFPAEVLAPRIGATLSPDNITLEWRATDIDNDIISNTVFLAMENPPTIEIAQTVTSRTTIKIDAPGIYFWAVTILDSEGNSSTSQTFQFRVN